MQIYDLLKHQSLFLGMSSDDYSNIVAYTHFGFETVGKHAVIASPQMPCKRLIMVTSGTVDIETVSDDGKLRILESVQAPFTIEPEHLFGRLQSFTSTYRSQNRCHILSLPKNDVLKLNAENLVFRINLLNYLATKTQAFEDFLWHDIPTTDDDRVMAFLHQHCITNKGKKVFKVKMVDLAEYIGISRLNLSKILNKMDSQGIINLQRGMITITF